MSVDLDQIGVPAPERARTVQSSPGDAPAATKVPARRQARNPVHYGDPDAITCTCPDEAWEASAASADELLKRARTVYGHQTSSALSDLVRGLRSALAVLQDYPGATWQERWNSSPAARHPTWLVEEMDGRGGKHSVHVTGLSALLVLGPIRPSYWWLGQQAFVDTFKTLRAVRDPEGAERVRQAADERGLAGSPQEHTLRTLSRLMMHTGKKVAEVTAADLHEYDAYVQATRDMKSRVNTLWEVLHGLGQIDGPTHLRQARHVGQRTTEQLVDQYGVESKTVRDLLVRYLRRRRPALDYTSFTQLTLDLVLLFWRQVEVLNPGIESLRLTEEQAEQWRERSIYKINRATGRLDESKGKRKDCFGTFLDVRAFYLDIAEWALAEPEVWAQWAAPSPIQPEHLSKYGDKRRERTARMHQRTRVQVETMPRLVAAATRRLEASQERLRAATAAPEGERFEVRGESFVRHVSGEERRFGSRGSGVVQARDNAGRVRNLTKEEDNAFWSWAIVEVLRETGIRVEELQELTHTAITPYTDRKSGETLVLLTVAPSKNSAERVLVVSPELMHVLASVLKRIRLPDGTVPLLSRWDEHEKQSLGPLPFLFAPPTPGGNRSCMSSRTVQARLNELVTEAGIKNPDGSPGHFTPHDFRRIFSTDVVAEGLPIHIAAAILGHRSLTTTQGYTAVYPEQVTQGYRQFLSHRRSLRPQTEYRAPTPDEWQDFENHFTLRKLELGDCSRPYGTPCKHEHACVRCPMLRPDPEQRNRLLAIQRNLQERLEEAERNGWGGEIAGLRETLRAAEEKLTQMSRSAGPVALGMPRLGLDPSSL